MTNWATIKGTGPFNPTNARQVVKRAQEDVRQNTSHLIAQN